MLKATIHYVLYRKVEMISIKRWEIGKSLAVSKSNLSLLKFSPLILLNIPNLYRTDFQIIYL